MLRSVVQDESRWVAELSDSVWQALAGMCRCGPRELRTDTLLAANVSGAFIFAKDIRPASQLPWSLVEGDISANLDSLSEGAKPSGPASANIWTLLRMNYPRAQLVEGIERIGDCSWSTVGVEQGHGSASTIRKQHSDYGRDMMMQRSMIHMMRPLVRPDELETKHQELESKV